jgi:hypothetical protein
VAQSEHSDPKLPDTGVADKSLEAGDSPVLVQRGDNVQIGLERGMEVEGLDNEFVES